MVNAEPTLESQAMSPRTLGTAGPTATITQLVRSAVPLKKHLQLVS